MENMAKCLKVLGNSNPKKEYGNVVLGIKTEKELMLKMNLLPESTKKTIIAKWGLDGTKVCTTFKALDSKLGVSNSRELYTMALGDLSKTEYLVSINAYGEMNCMFKEYSSVDFEKAVKYAKFVRTLLGKIEPFDRTVSEVAAIVENAFSTLTEREETILKLRLGFVDGTPKNPEEVGKKFGVNHERVRQIEARAIRKLSQQLYHQLFLASTINKGRVSLEEIGLTVQTYNCLRRAGCDSVEKFLGLSEGELRKIRNLGGKGTKECLNVQQKIREK